jgi:NADH-quinone oxidoreductase subunit K
MSVLLAKTISIAIGTSKIDGNWVLWLSAALFFIGALGALIRKNPLVMLMSIEIMLNAGNLALVGFSRILHDYNGQLFAILVMVVAAAEAVVGLAILVDIFRTRQVEVDDLNKLKH